MKYEAVIGLEIHVELNTKSKMFSSAPVSHDKVPNTNANIIDMGFPGVMPTVNKEAVIKALRVCNALNMTIDYTLVFDRKNYFYSDLPKGYQITQHFRPIGKNGYVVIKSCNKDKKIRINKLQLEEDSCKQVHTDKYTFLDYNRAGIPLIEIVTSPDIKTGEEAEKYIEKIKSIVSFLGVSDGKMEKGSLRCDTNVSVKPFGSETNGTKVEIKNVNGSTNVARAINYEIKRQTAILESGNKVPQETRRYDENKKVTVLMRVKADDVDYKYFTDANIVPIRLSDEFIKEAIVTSPELAEQRYQRYLSLGLNDYDSSLLVADVDVSNYFDSAAKEGVNPKLLANWILVDVQAVLNKENISINQFKVPPSVLAKLIKMVEEGKISNKQARELFSKMLENQVDPNKILEKSGIEQISDKETLRKVVIEVLDNNQKSIVDYHNGKDRVIGYLVGQVMKKTNGKANPTLVSEIVLEEIQRR